MPFTDDSSLILSFCFVVVVAILFGVRGRRPTPAPLPPGPRGLPIIGNAIDLLNSQPWIIFTQWAKKYGPIVHASALGKTLIVINDGQYAIDMLDKKSRMYNGRPSMIMAGDLLGWGESPALTQPTDTWDEYRRLFAQFMGTKAKVEGFSELLEYETGKYLGLIASSPQSWLVHTRKFAGSIVLRMTYGYEPSEKDDTLVKLVDDAMEHFSEATTMNAFLVDVFPILRYVPEWFPGAGWKQKARIYRENLQEMLNRPYAWAKEQIAAGTTCPCFIADNLKDHAIPEEEHTLKWIVTQNRLNVSSNSGERGNSLYLFSFFLSLVER